LDSLEPEVFIPDSVILEYKEVIAELNVVVHAFDKIFHATGNQEDHWGKSDVMQSINGELKENGVQHMTWTDMLPILKEIEGVSYNKGLRCGGEKGVLVGVISMEMHWEREAEAERAARRQLAEEQMKRNEQASFQQFQDGKERRAELAESLVKKKVHYANKEEWEAEQKDEAEKHEDTRKRKAEGAGFDN